MNSTTAGIGISRLGQVHIPAQDAERAARFYKDTLGLPLLFTTGNMAFFDCAGVRLMVSRPEGTEPYHAGSVLYFAVADISAACQILKGAGVRFEAEPHKIAEMPTHDLWMSFFRDSEENLVALMSEVPRA
jgi:methylmalonyl-CoA/ethylmalonyl-CoA epimerase